MSSQDFMKILEGTEYSFLRENEHLANKIMLLGLSGSYGYGTNREGSDVDFRGVAMQQPSDVLGLTEFEQYVDTGTDTVVYGFNKLVKLLLDIERFHSVPPVLFDDLLKMEMDPVLKEAIDVLVEKKKVTTEGEQNPQIPAIQAFIQEELQRQKAISDALPDDRNNNWTMINNCFTDMIGVTVR